MDRCCAVCKTPIDNALVVESSLGPVHPGECLRYVELVPVSESSDDLISECELLL